MCSAVYAALHFTSCSVIAFAPYKRTEQQLQSADSVVLVSVPARHLHFMNMAYVEEDSYKYTQQMLPAFKNKLTEKHVYFSAGRLDTAGDMLYEALRLLRRKNSDTMLLALLKKSLPPYNAPVLLFVNAATPPYMQRNAGGFYGGGFTADKEKGGMRIRSFTLLYKQEAIVYFDAVKFGGRYRAMVHKSKKANKIAGRLVTKLVRSTG